jgi:hypothetical protein
MGGLKVRSVQSVTIRTAMKQIETVAAAVAIRCLKISAERQDLDSPNSFAIACDMAISDKGSHSLAPADIDTFSS